MDTRNRTLLAVALAGALAAPVVLAQDTETTTRATTGVETSNDQVDTELPPRANERVDQADPRVPEVEATDNPMTDVPPPSPIESDLDPRDTDDAVDDAAIPDRSRWSDLDTDGDGRVSSEEGAMDADFTTNFSMMDSNGDGFVSDAEFTTHSRGAGVEPEEEEEDR